MSPREADSKRPRSTNERRTDTIRHAREHSVVTTACLASDETCEWAATGGFLRRGRSFGIKCISGESQRGHSGKRPRKALNDSTGGRTIAGPGFLGLWKDAPAFDRAAPWYPPRQILALSRRRNSRLG